MNLEFKRKELEDADARRDAMRKMTWFALMGMLLYPLGILITSMLGYEETAKIIGDIAPTYFVAISALVALLWCKCVCRQEEVNGRTYQRDKSRYSINLKKQVTNEERRQQEIKDLNRK